MRACFRSHILVSCKEERELRHRTGLGLSVLSLGVCLNTLRGLIFTQTAAAAVSAVRGVEVDVQPCDGERLVSLSHSAPPSGSEFIQTVPANPA